MWGGGWGGWILKRSLKVWALQGWVDLEGVVEFSNIYGRGNTNPE